MKIKTGTIATAISRRVRKSYEALRPLYFRITRRKDGNWDAILMATADEAMLLENPVKLRLRLTAARATFNDPVMVEVADIASRMTMPPSRRKRIALDLAAARKHREAWTVLAADEAVFTEPFFIPTAKRILNGIHDPDLRREIARRLGAVSRDGTLVKAVPSGLAFGRTATASPPRGSISLTGSSAVDPRHVALFEREHTLFLDRIRTLRTPKILELRDIHIDRFGQKWTRSGGLVENIGLATPTEHTDRASPVAVAIDLLRGTRGFYHWYVDALPKLAWLLNGANERPKILINAKGPAFEANTLRLLGFGPDDILKVDQPVFVERLLTPKVGFDAVADWGTVARLYETLQTTAAREATATPCEKLYISRRDAAGRRMVNERQLEKQLEERGFRICVMSTLPLADQIALTSAANVIVAPHGAGLSHIMHARPATTVVEILPIRDGSYRLRFNYARLSVIRGLRYFGWVEPQPYTLTDWTVDVTGFITHIDSILAKEI